MRLSCLINDGSDGSKVQRGSRNNGLAHSMRPLNSSPRPACCFHQPDRCACCSTLPTEATLHSGYIASKYCLDERLRHASVTSTATGVSIPSELCAQSRLKSHDINRY